MWVCYFSNPVVYLFVENSFGRLKQFRILSTHYRGDLEFLDEIVQVCAQLTNIDFETRPLRKSTKEERVAECEEVRIVQDQQQYASLPGLAEKRAAKLKKVQLQVNDRVSVWFDDKGKCFRGRIERVADNCWFEIEWIDQNEPNEVVQLEQCNRTKDVTNPDRWWKTGDKNLKKKKA